MIIYAPAKLTAALVVLALCSVAPAALSQERGSLNYGHKVEAAGMIFGVVFGVTVLFEVCPARFPLQREDFDRAFAEWKKRNAIADRARDAIYLAARQRGGDAEVRRVAGEFTSGIHEDERRLKTDFGSYSEERCALALSSMRQGLMDIEYVAVEELRLLGVH